MRVNKSFGHYFGLSVKGVFLFIMTFASLFPIYWTAVNSFRTNTQIYSRFTVIPEQFDFSSYQTIFTNKVIPTAFLNSVIITGSVMLISSIIILMASYALASYRFKAANYIYLLFVAAMFIPGTVTMGTVYKLIGQLGLLSSRPGVILVYVSGRIAFSVFLMVSFMHSIPDAVQEAAIIDGCNSFSLLTRIIAPLSRNGMLVVLILTFINVWNEYMWAMIMLPSRSLRTLTVALAFFKSEYTTDYALLSAGVVVGILPILIVYLFLQEKIINGLVAASVKG